MAFLKKIKFGTGEPTSIAKTLVQGKPEGVISVSNTSGYKNNDTEEKDYSYDIDVNVDNATIVKSSGSLAVGTVPAERVSVNNSNAGITATTAQAAFKELKQKIDAVDGAAKSYKIVKVDNPATTSYAEYKIQEKAATGEWGDVTGSSPIVVPKDNAFVTAQLGHVGATADASTGAITDGDGKDALLIEYVNGSGVYTLVAVPIGEFLKEAEFKDGLQVNNGEVSVKVNSDSEKDSEDTDFLTVGVDGVKIQGIKNEIDRKIAALDVTNDAAVAGKYVAAIEETDGKVAVKERANVSEAVLNNYAKGTVPTSLDIAATDTINQALAKLEHQVDAAKAAATTKVVEGTDAGNNMSITTVTSETDGSTTYTINLTDVASKAALDAEIAARKAVDGQSGQTYAANTGTNYINNATSLNDADVKLDAELKTEVDRAKSAETSIDAAIGLTKGGNNETRTYANTGEYIGKEASNTVTSDIKALDTKLKEVADGLAAVQYKVNGTTLEFFGMGKHA